MGYSNLTGVGTWGITAAAFANPMYLQAPVSADGNTDSTGFDISDASAVIITFEGTYTGQTVVHQQTLDPTGEAGWFTAYGAPGSGGAAVSTGATAGASYTFPALGQRHRIKVTALSTGTIETRILLKTALSAGGAAGGSGGSLSATSTAAAPTYSEGASEALSMDLHGGARALIMDENGLPVDFGGIVPVSQSGTWNLNDISGTVSLPTGAATAVKQPALGTAGSASADVLTIQGIASGVSVIIGGPTADDAAASGNPVPVGGKYNATLPTYTDGDRTQAQFTSNGALIIGGSTASGATDIGNPVKVGGVYNTTRPTLSTGQRGDVQLTNLGEIVVSIGGGTGGSLVNAAASSGDALSTTTRGITSLAFAYVFNGSTWDRRTKPNAVGRLVSSAASTNGTAVKASAGNVSQITLYNSNAAVRYLKLYNKATTPTVGTDTPIMTIALAPSTTREINFGNDGFYFSTGIGYGLTTGSADNDTGAVGAGDILGLNIAYS